eukprot:Transcript_30409.p1 GENE.Transcript_30409~~Transcript_30409.p1  ORF type:complete len:190 (+),score=74.19 Transcript_30409:48-617(+)
MTSSIDAIFASAEQEFLAAGRAAGAAAAPANSSAADSGMPVFAPAETTAAGEPESSQASLPPPPPPAAQPANNEEPYAASDDELDDAPPGAGSGDARRGRKRGEPSSRSSFKARVIKEVKTKLHAFYSAGRITSKEDFKQLAKETSHKILSKDPKRTTWDDKMPGRVQKYVDGLFARDFIYDPSRKKGR